MNLGEGIQKRMEELLRRQPEIMPRLREIAEGATLRAVEEATIRTPPNTFENGEIRGVNMISGELAQHWATDSQTIPEESGGSLVTVLANDKQYASYVNDGHRVDKHFVPGLYVDDSGLLSRDLTKDVGMVVGTKTQYVSGLYVKEKAEEKYKEVAEQELEKLAGEVFQ